MCPFVSIRIRLYELLQFLHRQFRQGERSSGTIKAVGVSRNASRLRDEETENDEREEAVRRSELSTRETRARVREKSNWGMIANSGGDATQRRAPRITQSLRSQHSHHHIGSPRSSCVRLQRASSSARTSSSHIIFSNVLFFLLYFLILEIFDLPTDSR